MPPFAPGSSSSTVMPPAIDGTNPTEVQARDRVALLAGRNASVVSADWYPLPGVLATVVPRGTAASASGTGAADAPGR
ncbi:hypothetical protein [Streptomyces pratisoli]|uniref:hypothetical protein n=1 Tax=Streptomyces pratisoli TaxID=3139917 RepID=UPI003C12C400